MSNMFRGMGMFGAGFSGDPFFFDGEEDPVKRIKEEHKEKERQRSFEESLKKEITISKEDFMSKAAKVISDGRFVDMAMKKDPKMGMTLALVVSPIMAELAAELFDMEEDKENGGE